MADFQAALNELFAPNGGLPQNVIDTMLSTLRMFSLSPEELFYKWESYVMKMGIETTRLDEKTARDFKKDLQDQLERDTRAKSHATQSASKKTAATPRAGGTGGDVFGMLDGLVSGTPAARGGNPKRKGNFDTPAPKAAKNGLHSSPSHTPSAAPTTSFLERPNAGQIVEEFNSHLPAGEITSTPPLAARARLKANTDLQKFGYKGMAMKLSEASEMLDDRIDSFTELVQAHHRLPDSAFGNPAAQSTAEIVATGRICCDSANAKLTATGLVLETSRRMGAGLRIPLKMDGISYDFFPGKIVALRGTNVSGEYFSVTEVLSMPLLPVASSLPAELDVHNDRVADTDGTARPLNLMMASGPYTTDADLSFAPLYTLLDKAQNDQADVLILTGPFLDVDHPVVAAGDFEAHLPEDAKIEPDKATMNDVFRCLISQPLQRLSQALPSITIIMVPSARDIINRHVSWPQDRFPKASLGLPKQCQVVTNPIMLSINEMVVGISSQDVLSEMRKENVCQGPKGQGFNDDLLARLARNLVDQRHFFPIFPPQAQDSLPKVAKLEGEVQEAGLGERLPTGVNLDLGYLKLGEWLNVKPDVLVLPSMLTPFAAKVVESVLCINPGMLSKKRGAGTFVNMALQPRSITDEEREAGQPVAHNIFQRARVEVVRI